MPCLASTRRAMPKPALHGRVPSLTVLCSAPSLAVPRLTSPCSARPSLAAFLASPCLAAPCLASPCRAATPCSLPRKTPPCHTLPSLDPPCHGTMLLAKPGPALPRRTLPCQTSPAPVPCPAPSCRAWPYPAEPVPAAFLSDYLKRRGERPERAGRLRGRRPPVAQATVCASLLEDLLQHVLR